MIVKITPMIISGIPLLGISLNFTKPVPWAMATVGSAVGNKKESEHAIATGTAYIPTGKC